MKLKPEHIRALESSLESTITAAITQAVPELSKECEPQIVHLMAKAAVTVLEAAIEARR